MEVVNDLVSTNHLARNPRVGGIPASLARITIVIHLLFFENVSLFKYIIFVLFSNATIRARDAQ